MYDKLQEIRERRENGEKGFTLIELLVVVVIIGILVAIAIPLYLHFENGAKASSAETDTHALTSLVKLCQSDNGGTLPASVAGASGTFAFTEAACAGDTQNLSKTNTADYTVGTYDSTTSTFTAGAGTDFEIKVTNTESGKVATYESGSGQTVLS